MYNNIQDNRYLRTQLALMLSLFLLLLCAPCWAQKKEMATARDLVKAGKDLDKAQKSMEKLLADSANRDNKKIWAIRYDAVRKQYEQGNEKLYLKQKYDTAQLFCLARQLFLIAAQMDSLEQQPDRKGRVNFDYRKEHAEYLAQIRPNLYNGGAWYVRRQKYADAYALFDTYIESASQPLFGHYDYKQQDAHLPQAAYWAVYCGYKLGNPRATLHHSYEALKDTAHYNYMLQYLAETYKLEKDTARYVQTLREGFAHAPKFPFFFPRLVEYYAAQHQLDSAMAVVSRALEVDSASTLYLYTKSTVLLEQGKNRECIALCDTLIARGDTLAECYYNAGLAYFNMAVALDKNVLLSRRCHQKLVDYYQRAMPYLETYRRQRPAEQGKWALPLYTIYLNLNKGKEFDEIDKILKK